MAKRLGIVLVVGLALVALGCASDPPQTTDLGKTGAALTVEVAPDGAVTGFQYDIQPVDCATGSVLDKGLTFVVGLEDMTLPDGIPGFINNPFIYGSKHAFADLFVVLAEGCYDVTATPMDGDVPSETCAAATKKGVKVNDGKTTEILLVCQCEGEPLGALDTIATLNHPPVLVNLTYEPSKFLNMCEKVVVCATFADEDGDPLRFVWKKNDAKLWGPFKVSQTRHGNQVTECVMFIPYCVGDWNLSVTAYDVVADNNQWITVEEYLATTFTPALSHDDLEFPLHVGFMPHTCRLDEFELPTFTGDEY